MIPSTSFSLAFQCLALLASPALAQLPYNPTRILLSPNASSAYIFSPLQSSSQFHLARIDFSDTIDPSLPLTNILSPTLPFISSQSSNSFTPVINDEGDISVLSGNCSQEFKGTQLWAFAQDQGGTTGTWSQLSLSSEDLSLGASFLSAGMSFSPTASSSDASVYVFGGMCPTANATASNATASTWISDAVYSNNMMYITPESAAVSGPSSSDPYELSITGVRGPPIPEAGLTITPLLPTYSNTSSAAVSQGQNYVLLGGHTQRAFINMSQVALFSLPESSWSFLAVEDPVESSKTDLMSRDVATVVEPRSGHTAVLSEDGSRIIVLGGWVGDISIPAQPQLAVLEVGQSYGGSSSWSWSIPSVTNSPFQADQGIYGHGAVMLPGGVMMIAGGYDITSSSSSRRRRRSQPIQTANTKMLLFNVTSSTWITSYTHPVGPSTSHTVTSSGGALSTSAQKVGLGVGLVLGLLVVAILIAVYITYSRRLKQKRETRQRELRELALGAEKFHSGPPYAPVTEDQAERHPALRTASWNDRQERRISIAAEDVITWAPPMSHNQASRKKCACIPAQREGGQIRLIEQEEPVRRKCECKPERNADEQGEAERTGVLVENPSPTRGLRKSVLSKVPSGYGQVVPNPLQGPSHTPHMVSGIHRIDEMEEESSENGSAKRKLKPRIGIGNLNSMYSDPFKDPTPQINPEAESSDPARQQREQEIQGWVHDWNAAAVAMEVPRHVSQAGSHRRAQSNVSGTGSVPHSGGTHSGRGSPEKSDRTGSNLSEQSLISATSIQRSVVGSITRTMSLRSASAGYALFSGAAAAVASRIGGGLNPSVEEVGQPGSGKVSPTRALSRRSSSLNFNFTASSRRPVMRERSDTFSTARTSFGPAQPSEGDALLVWSNSQRGPEDEWATPPQSPVKDRSGSIGRPGSSGAGAAGGWIGSVRRVLSRNGDEEFGVRRRAAEYHQRSETPRSLRQQPQMVETEPRRAASASATFWRGKRGAKDWEDDAQNGCNLDRSSSTLNGKSTSASGQTLEDESVLSDTDEWDVEAAVQKRVVQVMFTVPKEKLRVVNVDSLSILSKSDTGLDGDDEMDEREEIKRVRTVGEEDEAERFDEDGEPTLPKMNNTGKWKGKGKQIVIG